MSLIGFSISGIPHLFEESADFCADLESRNGGVAAKETASGNDVLAQTGRRDAPIAQPKLDGENAEDPSKIEQKALEILRAADAKAEATILAAIQGNDGIDPGPHDLDTSGVGYAKEMAVKIRQAGNTLATERLYDSYADCNMTRASSAAGFIATLDIVFQRVVDVLKGQTDRVATKALRKKWVDIASERKAMGWFVARSQKVTMSAQIEDSAFWSDLERRFRDLGNEFGDTLRANWTSAAWGADAEQWYLGGPQGREREMFETLAERAAVGLGHPAGDGALFFWFDQLKSAGLNFRAGYKGTDTDGNVSHGGTITRLSEASAGYCFKMGTKFVVRHGSTERISPSPPKLNLPLINKWMKDEGYSNEELAAVLKVSVRTVSSLRNNGDYHGEEAITKLANLMKRDVDDLCHP